MPTNQGLLIRNSSLSPEEFSNSWYKDHAALVVPYFLSYGVTYYAQVHGPLTTADQELKEKLKGGEYDGAAEMQSEDVAKIFAPGAQTPELNWRKEYYEEVILKDEERLLVSRATEHILQVPPGTVEGRKRVVIQGGKCLINIPEGVWELWRSYEAMGSGKVHGN